MENITKAILAKETDTSVESMEELLGCRWFCLHGWQLAKHFVPKAINISNYMYIRPETHECLLIGLLYIVYLYTLRILGYSQQLLIAFDNILRN